MGFIELLLVAVGLSMDAFAVAVCKGLSVQKLRWKHYLAVGLWFGGFQALMPMVGYLLGTTFERYITSVDHWVAFVLLCLIGGNMLKEGLSRDEEREGQAENVSFGFKAMLMLAWPPVLTPWRWALPLHCCRMWTFSAPWDSSAAPPSACRPWA